MQPGAVSAGWTLANRCLRNFFCKCLRKWDFRTIKTRCFFLLRIKHQIFRYFSGFNNFTQRRFQWCDSFPAPKFEKTASARQSSCSRRSCASDSDLKAPRCNAAPPEGLGVARPEAPSWVHSYPDLQTGVAQAEVNADWTFALPGYSWQQIEAFTQLLNRFYNGNSLFHLFKRRWSKNRHMNGPKEASLHPMVEWWWPVVFGI